MFGKAIERAEPAEDVKGRVLNLIDFITYSVYIYTSRGLFEKDKLIFVSQMCLTVSISIMKKTKWSSKSVAIFYHIVLGSMARDTQVIRTTC